MLALNLTTDLETAVRQAISVLTHIMQAATEAKPDDPARPRLLGQARLAASQVLRFAEFLFPRDQHPTPAAATNPGQHRAPAAPSTAIPAPPDPLSPPRARRPGPRAPASFFAAAGAPASLRSTA